MDPTTIRLLIWGGVGLVIFIFAKSKGRDLLAKVKENLFTPHSFVLAFLYVLTICGLVIPVYLVSNFTYDLSMFYTPPIESAKKGK